MGKRRVEHQKELEALSFAELYPSVPVRNETARVQEVGERLIVAVPLKRPRGLYAVLEWFFLFSKQHRLELDELGASVLRACDGRATVRALIEDFAARHKLTFHEARVLIMMFLKKMLERGIVAVLVPDPEVGER